MNTLSRRPIQLLQKQKVVPQRRFIQTSNLRFHSTQVFTASKTNKTNIFSNTQFQKTQTLSVQKPRFFAVNALQQKEVSDRILKVVKDFHRVGESVTVSENSHFIQDLGLDSLDEVELLLAVEDEFAVEIPDAEAEKIHSVSDAVKYILVNKEQKKATKKKSCAKNVIELLDLLFQTI